MLNEKANESFSCSLGRSLVALSPQCLWCGGWYTTVDCIRVVLRENPSSGFLIRFDTNLAVQPQKMARDLKFWYKEVEGLYSLCSENKGDDQLCGYRTADLRLCFCICKKHVFS